MRKTTDEERPVKQTPEERKTSHRADHLERMKEHEKMMKEHMKKFEDDPGRLVHLQRHLDRIKKHIKDYEDKIKGI